MNIYLDIETIPSQNEEDHRYLTEKLAKRTNEWAILYEEERRRRIGEEMRKTSLNGTYGEIIVIGYAINGENPKALYRKSVEDDEYALLLAFWTEIAERNRNSGQTVTWIGHNVRWFDLRFLDQRAMKHGAPPTIELWDEGWNNVSIHDTMIHHTKSRHEHISLDELCRFFGIPGKREGIDGSNVWDAYQAGRIAEIVNYCKADVELARTIYNHQTYSSGFNRIENSNG